MSTASKVAISEGNGDKFTATYAIAEGGDTKEIQRLALNDGAGLELKGARPAAESLPVALSTEDRTLIDGIEALLTTQNGYLDGVEASLTSLLSLVALTNVKLDALSASEAYTLSTTAITGVKAGTYYWAVQATFAGSTIKLQAKGPAGTFLDIETMTSSGIKGVGVGDNAELRLAYAGGTPSGVESSLT